MTESRKKSLREMFTAAGALMLIAGVITAALAGTNALTMSAIQKRQEEEATAARRQVMDADSFEERTLSSDDGDVRYYVGVRDGAEVGYVFTVTTTGKSAGLTVMTGITADGAVSGVVVTENEETAGYVDKVIGDGLLDRLQGQTDAAGIQAVDGTSTATKTSDGIKRGVAQAMTYYEAAVKGGATG